MDTFNSRLTQAKENFRMAFADDNLSIDTIRQHAGKIAVLGNMVAQGMGSSLYDPEMVREQTKEMNQKGMNELLNKMDISELINVINDPEKFSKKLNEFFNSKKKANELDSNAAPAYIPPTKEDSYIDTLEKQEKASYGFAKMSARNAHQALRELQDISKKNPDELDEAQTEKAKNNMAKVMYYDVLRNDEKALKAANNTAADSAVYDSEIGKFQNSDQIRNFTERITFDGIAEFAGNPKTYKRHLAVKREETAAQEKTMQRQKELVKQQPSKAKVL